MSKDVIQLMIPSFSLLYLRWLTVSDLVWLFPNNMQNVNRASEYFLSPFKHLWRFQRRRGRMVNYLSEMLLMTLQSSFLKDMINSQ